MKDITSSVYNFEDLKQGNFLYVDKTEYIWQLIKPAQEMYFLSRPRRFGKSLTVSTFKAVFEGKKELFKGLAIYDKPYDWKPYPVIHLSFGDYNPINNTAERLDIYLTDKIKTAAKDFNIEIPQTGRLQASGGSKKITIIRILLRKFNQVRRTTRYNKIRDSFATDEKTILFSTFDGRNYSDSPKAIYLRMLSDPKYKDYKLVWVFREPENHIEMLENPNTYIVKTNTVGFEEMCATAKYWFFNYRVADHIYPKDDQVYVELWHGTPLKRLGYDIEVSDNAMNSKSEIRDKYRVDAEKFKYILANN